jgi:hypothetical protein
LQPEVKFDGVNDYLGKPDPYLPPDADGIRWAREMPSDKDRLPDGWLERPALLLGKFAEVTDLEAAALQECGTYVGLSIPAITDHIRTHLPRIRANTADKPKPEQCDYPILNSVLPEPAPGQVWRRTIEPQKGAEVRLVERESRDTYGKDAWQAVERSPNPGYDWTVWPSHEGWEIVSDAEPKPSADHWGTYEGQSLDGVRVCLMSNSKIVGTIRAGGYKGQEYVDGDEPGETWGKKLYYGDVKSSWRPLKPARVEPGQCWRYRANGKCFVDRLEGDSAYFEHDLDPLAPGWTVARPSGMLSDDEWQWLPGDQQ